MITILLSALANNRVFSVLTITIYLLFAEVNIRRLIAELKEIIIRGSIFYLFFHCLLSLRVAESATPLSAATHTSRPSNNSNLS